ncbi:actinodin2 [Aplochiton taeniatus]
MGCGFGTSAVSEDVKVDAINNLRALVRNRRNAPLPQFKRMPDFWGWYKYFMESGNQEGIEDLDRLYLAHLQNKHRSEEAPTFNHYLAHLSEIYKACADSDNPECIAESTSKPTAKVVMPAPIKKASVRVCNPHYDPYCLFPLVPKGATAEPEPEPAAPIFPYPILPAPIKGGPGFFYHAAPEPAPQPANVPIPILSPLLPAPMKGFTGHYYYAPILEPFLSAEQKAELLRICSPSDTKCLQYHLRAAYGYRPAPGPAPSYSALTCDQEQDPYCKPFLVKKAPTGYYHIFPNCDPAVDPLCVASVAAPLASEEEHAREQHCNPLFEEGCNPLTATKLAGLTKPAVEHPRSDEPAAPEACDPRYNPYCLLGLAAALRKPPLQLPMHQIRSRLGVRGKTKEGHDCYMHYDKDCHPVEEVEDAKGDAKPACHPFDPSCGKLPPAAGPSVPKNGVVLPDPHCDPEIDYNCRLRRSEVVPAAKGKSAGAPAPQAADVPVWPIPIFQGYLKGYMGNYKKK